MMTSPQEQRRKQAITRYLDGDKIEAICRDMHCSKSWLYKWRDRYQPDDPGWATSRGTQPRNRPRQLPQSIEQRVVACRQTLASKGKKWSAAAIQEELQQQEIEPIPSLRTIYRMLQRHAQGDV